mmetsp:Transcript_6707/g.14649  ORF Transcript_6707/g.14649 Transcript_6707/m.14649 type:complete len:368 (-) Transcript_6707:290-1393(-)
MLRPVDRLDVDPLLHHLPQRAHLAKPVHVLDAHLDGVVHLRLGREAADAEADRGVRHLLVDAERAEDVRRLERGGGAGGAARHRNVLERHQQALALHVRKRHVEVARVPALHRSVDGGVRDVCVDAVDEALHQPLDMRSVALHLSLRHRARSAKADGQRRGQRAAPQAALLPSSREDRFEADARPPPNVEGADALWTVELVRRDGHQVDAELVHVDSDLANRLRCIDVEEDLALLAELADLLNRLDDANLVVDVHDRDEARVGAHRRRELVHVDQAVLLDRKEGDVEALLLQVAARVEHALVLGLRGDDVVLSGVVEVGDALDGHVVRLGRARREDDLLALGAHERRNLVPGLLDRLVGLPSVRVRL